MNIDTNRGSSLFPRQFRQMRLRFDHLLLERNHLKVAATHRQIVELVTAILGGVCFLVFLAVLLGGLGLPHSVWLLPSIAVLGAAFLTFSFTSAYFRQEELDLDRRWRSYSLRCTDLIADLQNLLRLKYKKKRLHSRVEALSDLQEAQPQSKASNKT